MSDVVQGKPYRYGYAVSARPPTSYGNALSKFDMEAGTSKQWHEAGCIPVEPVMIPRPGAQASPSPPCLPSLLSQDAGIASSEPTVRFLQHLKGLQQATAPVHQPEQSHHQHQPGLAWVCNAPPSPLVSWCSLLLTSAELRRTRMMEWC